MKNTDDLNQAYYDYYDNHDFTEDIEIAKKNGDALYCKAGENPIEAFKKHIAEKNNKANAAATKTTTIIAAPRRAVAAAVL